MGVGVDWLHFCGGRSFIYSYPSWSRLLEELLLTKKPIPPQM